LLAATLLASPAFADDVVQQAKAQQVAAVPAMAGPFGQPLTLRGKLGDDPVQMHLQPKTEEIDSVEGSYEIHGHTGKILLAGEVTGNALTMEESQDGVDVSGQWDGKLEGKTLHGTWTSDDGSTSKSFTLELLTKLTKKSIKAAKSTH
jgi:hypothetical protein